MNNEPDPAATDRLVDAVEAAVAIWSTHARCASSYLGRRGLVALADDPASFGLGYAQMRRSALSDELLCSGFDRDTVIGAGLAVPGRDGRLVDRFRGRLMFPLGDHRTDRAVGAIGRDIADRPGSPKYLNSPASAIFDKSSLLFGLAENAELLRAGSTPVFVEGPLDALAVNLAAAGEAVGLASCGTSLTTAQVAAAADAASPTLAIIAPDGDEPGALAGVRASNMLAARFAVVRWMPALLGDDVASAFAKRQLAAASFRGLPTVDEVCRGLILPTPGVTVATVCSHAPEPDGRLRA